MRKTVLLLLAVATCNCASTCDTMPPDSVLRADITPEELEKEPGYNQMKGAILSDVRVWRELDRKVEVEGVHEVPVSVIFSEGVATCGVDKSSFEVYKLRNDLIDQPYRIDETAYLCRKEGVYYYHYQGGPRKLDVWLGPFRIERKRPAKTDPQ
jgi:hypothetical protein